MTPTKLAAVCAALTMTIACFATGCGKQGTQPAATGPATGKDASPTGTSTKEKEKAEVVEARQLLDDFAGKQEEAFKKYGNKLLELEGVVFNESKSSRGQPLILHLVEVNRANQPIVQMIVCQFEPGSEHYEKALQLSEGQKVKIRGRYNKPKSESGLMIVAPHLFECALVETGPDPVISVSAEQLTKDFASDEKAAALKYKGKPLIIEGTVAQLDHKKDAFLEAHTVYLQGHDPKADKPVRVMVFNFDKGAFAKLKEGQRIKVKGKCVTGNPGAVDVLYSRLLSP